MILNHVVVLTEFRNGKARDISARMYGGAARAIAVVMEENEKYEQKPLDTDFVMQARYVVCMSVYDYDKINGV